MEVGKREGSQPILSLPESSGSCGGEGILDLNPWAGQPTLEQHTCDGDPDNSALKGAPEMVRYVRLG